MKNSTVTLGYLVLLGCVGGAFAQAPSNPTSLPATKPAAASQPALDCTVKPLQTKMTLAVPLGLEVTLHNSSAVTAAVPAPTRGMLGWRHRVAILDADEQVILYRPGVSGTHPGEVLAKASDFVLIKPGATHKFVYWTADDINPLVPMYGQPPRLRPGKVTLAYTFSPDCVVGKDLSLADAVAWKGSLTAKLPLAVEAADPAAAVGMNLELVKQHDDPQVRAAVRASVSYLACRLFGPDGWTDHSAADLEEWFKAEGGRGRQQWIVDALSSKVVGERVLARDAVLEVKDKSLADGLVGALDARDIETTVRIFEAVWVNYGDPRALAFARGVLRDGPALSRCYLLNLAQQRKIDAIVKEGSESLPAWMKAETEEKELAMLISTAAHLKSRPALAYLEELDAKDETPAPKEFILAMCEYKGKAYEARLIHHLATNKSEEARLWAAWAMASWGSDNCTETLIAALADSSAKVRPNACYALGVVMEHPTADQYRRAVGGLTKLLPEDPSPSLSAHNALIKIEMRRPKQ